MKVSKKTITKLMKYIARLGGDLTKSREVEFFLYFPSEFEAVQAEVEIFNLQFHTHLKFVADSDEWLCLATKNLLVSTDRLIDISLWMDELAMRFGGHYEGWGTKISI